MADQKPSQRVTLDAWTRIHFGPKKLDKAAGFVRWAKNRGDAEPRSRPDWQDLYEQYKRTPVGPKSPEA